MSFPRREDLSRSTLEQAQDFFERYNQSTDNKKEAQKAIAEDLGIDDDRIFRWVYVVRPRIEGWPNLTEEERTRLLVEHGFEDADTDASADVDTESSRESDQESGEASDEEVVRVSTQELANALGVKPKSVRSSASRGFQSGGYPVADWIVRGGDEATNYWDVPSPAAQEMGLDCKSDTETVESADEDAEDAASTADVEGEFDDAEELKQEADVDPAKLQKEKQEEEDNPFAVDDKYDYIEHQDLYLLDISSFEELYAWPGSKARELAVLYSDFDDNGWTLDMCARHFGFPVHVMQEIKEALNLRHKSPPRLREEFIDGDVDDFVQDDIAKLERSYQEKLEKKTYRNMKRKAKKWTERASRIDKRSKRQAEKLSDLSEDYDVPTLILPFDDDAELPRGALFCNWQDLHIGRRRYRDDNGLEQYQEDLLSGADKLFGRAAMTTTLDKIYVVVGADLSHADTYEGETTRGTPQDCVANPTEIEEACEDFMVRAIDKARQALKAHSPDATVELVPVFGNHDRKTSFSIYRFLYAWYHDVDGVEVPLDYDERVYRQYRNWFISATHGDVSKKQMRKMPRIMMQESRDIFADTEQMVLYTGHLHEEVMKVDAGVKQHQAPSPAQPDRYDNRNAYVGQPKVLPGHILFADSPDDQFMNAGILS